MPGMSIHNKSSRHLSCTRLFTQTQHRMEKALMLPYTVAASSS